MSQAASFPGLPTFKLPAPESDALYRYNGFKSASFVLPKGHKKEDGCLPLPEELIFDRDTAITVRDGTKLYADIFRASKDKDKKVPALLPWSPYGKSGCGPQQYHTMGPFECGVPKNTLSGYHKFEAPDPAEWCARGYAIVNVDARGAYDSEGDLQWWGQQEAEDIYDTIEWLARQPWCNGSVGMTGNSWLAICQINLASRCVPPSLKCLAPWECASDPYMDICVRGGIPAVPFQAFIQHGFAGRGTAVDMAQASVVRPFYDEWWKSLHIDVNKIPASLPLYQLASYSTGLHTPGSIRTFRHAPAQNKWLRVHRQQEWSDYYRPEITDELQRYFDRYLKGIDNGFERDTPKVRLSLVGCGTVPDVIERAEASYPLERQHLQTYYLDASSKSGSLHLPSTASTASYEGHHLTDTCDFYIGFERDTELAGYPMVELFMSCPSHDDLDVFIQIRKVDHHGKLLAHANYPMPVPVDEVPDVNVAKYLGATGRLRASHACTYDDAASTENEPVYKHDRREPIEPKGKVVRLRIPIWPIGMVFAAGEGVVVRVAGHDLACPEIEMLRPTEPIDANIGEHIVHTGGDYPSRVILPFIKG